MAAAYMLADVVVSASTDPEAFGRVAAEAHAMGRPVIASDHGGSRETVIAGETAGEIDGMVVPTGAVVVVGMEAADIIVAGMEEDIVIGVDGGKS